MSLESNLSKKVESADNFKEVSTSASTAIAAERDSHAGSDLHKTTNKESEIYTTAHFGSAESIIDFGAGKSDYDRRRKTDKSTDSALSDGGTTGSEESTIVENSRTRNDDGNHGPGEDQADPKDDQTDGDLKGGDDKGSKQKKGWKSSKDQIKNAGTPM